MEKQIVSNKNNISSNWKKFLSKQKKSFISKPSKKKKEEVQVVVAEEDDEPKHVRERFLSKLVALDCEMVGIGEQGVESMLARVSLVNHKGECLYDKYVLPREHVIDFRTHVSGIRPEHFQKALPFDTVQKEVAELLKNKILVGHAIKNDLQVLFLSHPRRFIRDTSVYKPIRTIEKNKPSLKSLAKKHLNLTIQEGEHDSVEDARVTMNVYLLHRKQWEKNIKMKNKKNKK